MEFAGLDAALRQFGHLLCLVSAKSDTVTLGEEFAPNTTILLPPLDWGVEIWVWRRLSWLKLSLMVIVNIDWNMSLFTSKWDNASETPWWADQWMPAERSSTTLTTKTALDSLKQLIQELISQQNREVFSGGRDHTQWSNTPYPSCPSTVPIDLRIHRLSEQVIESILTCTHPPEHLNKIC